MSNEYDGHTGKLLAALAQNMPYLSGAEMDWIIQNPLLAREALARAFIHITLKPWKTVIVSDMCHHTYQAVPDHFCAKGYRLNPAAVELFANGRSHLHMGHLEFYQVSRVDLGLSDDTQATMVNMRRRAKDVCNLEPCTKTDVAALLLADHISAFSDKRFTVMMESAKSRSQTSVLIIEPSPNHRGTVDGLRMNIGFYQIETDVDMAPVIYVKRIPKESPVAV